jgi:glycosyltransferase involved in cell wall biosynthesis
VRQGHEVEVLTPRHERAWPVREEADGLPIRRFPLTDLSRRARGVRGFGVPNLWIERGQVRRAVRAALPGFDLLHAHLASPIVAFAVPPAHELGVPVLCKVACGGSDFDFRSLEAGSLLGPRLVRGLVERMDRWVAISDEVRADLIRAGVPEARIASIPNGIDPDAHPPGRTRGPARRFLCLGRLGKFDLARLFEAFDALLAALPEAELRVSGRGDEAAAAALLARFPRARARTAVVDFTPSAEAMDWADALVHPSLAEGMSNALLEAMCAGLPCVASDIPPNREVLGGAALLVPLGDATALGAGMRRLALEPALGAELARAARRRAGELFAIDRIASRYGALYGEILAERAERRGRA